MGIGDKLYKTFFGEPPKFTNNSAPKQDRGAKGPEPKAEAKEQHERRVDFRASEENIPKRAVKKTKDEEGNEQWEEVAAKDRVSEDSTVADEELGLFAVADGVGSGGHGDEASRIGIEAFHKEVQALKEIGGKELDNKTLMRLAMERASDALDETKRSDPRDLEAMNTTLTALLLQERPDGMIDGTVGHVGDSRAYHFRAATQELLPLTRDDNASRDFVEIGVLTAAEAKRLDQSMNKGKDAAIDDAAIRARVANAEIALERQTEQEKGRPIEVKKAIREKLDTVRSLSARLNKAKDAGELLYKMRNEITQALGSHDDKKPNFSVESFVAEPGDLVFAVSDGISDVLTEEEIYAMVKEGMDQKQSAADILKSLARAAAENVSPRQKGKALLQNDAGEPVLFQGDDVGISGARIERKVQAQEQPNTEAQETQARYTAEQIAQWREDLQQAAGDGSLDEAVAETLLAKALAQNPEFAHFDVEDGDMVYEKFGSKMVPLRLGQEKGNDVVLIPTEGSGVPFASKIVPKSELGRLFQQTVDVKDAQYRTVQKDLLQEANIAAKRQAK